jgi:PBP1b-binding outer membrane lipoprotein LpoB
MKALKKWLKSITLFFISIMMFQGCVAYQSASVILEQAVREQKRTKINTISQKKYHYEQIVFEEGKFYGLKKLNKNMVKIPLDTHEIDEVFIQSKSKSTWLTVAIIAIPLIALTIIAINDLNNSFKAPAIFGGE